VLAWLAGLAHARESAIAVWEKLPKSLARAALGVESGSKSREQLRRDLDDPWHLPGAPPTEPALRVVASFGGFRGYGGPFLTPPRVFVARQQLWAADAENAWSLHADCFGLTLQRTASPPAPEKKRKARVELSADGTVRLDELSAQFPLLARASAFAAAGPLVAFTLTRSHRIVLVARTGGRR
jgi:hypothetical protein